ncbi:MAG: Ig-like domain-containing protein [Thermodesulfobacteriota bacterium]
MREQMHRTGMENRDVEGVRKLLTDPSGGNDCPSLAQGEMPGTGPHFGFGQSWGFWGFSAVVMGALLLVTFLWLGVRSASASGVSSQESGSKAPRVVSTFPANESRDVDPGITEISVTFDREMTDQSWSWAYEDKNRFPQVVGQPYYTDGKIRNALPVKLEPNKAYLIWINTSRFRNFKDKSGTPAVPFKFTFTTGASR